MIFLEFYLNFILSRKMANQNKNQHPAVEDYLERHAKDGDPNTGKLARRTYKIL